MSCELYILLTASDFIDEQVHMHWALSYFKRCGELHQAHFTTGVEVREDVLCILEQLHRGIHIDILPRERGNHSAHATGIQSLLPKQTECRGEFKDFIDLSSYTDPTAIILKFR
jgi:hypothetical protein